jgi:hypothetical protein
MTNKKSITAFVLSSAMVAGALVADAVSHHRLVAREAMAPSAAATAPANSAPAIPKPDAGVKADTTTETGTDSTSGEQAKTDTAAAQDTGAGNTSAVQGQVQVDNNNGNSQTVPTEDASQSQTAAVAAPVVLAAASIPDAIAPVTLAPRHSLTVPAGAVLTICLGEELASDTSEIGQNFTATLDRDVTVNGKAAIVAGAPVTGKVSFARPIGPITGEPILELRLISVNVNNTDAPIVTAIRTFGPKIRGKNKVSRFVKGLYKRYEHQEQEVVLDDQSTYSFTLRQPLVIR